MKRPNREEYNNVDGYLSDLEEYVDQLEELLSISRDLSLFQEEINKEGHD